MQINTGVYRRTGIGNLSSQAFYAATGLALAWGFGLTAILASVFKNYYPSFIGVILLGIVTPIIGIIIAARSSKVAVSFLGYNMICIPFGVILGPVLDRYSAYVIQNVFTMTLGIALIMTISGILFPNFYSRIGGALSMAILAFLIISIIGMFIAPLRNSNFIHYIGAGIFSLYIGYDMFRASFVPRTFDNAVDIAIDLYLDILNLFLQLLSIDRGRRS